MQSIFDWCVEVLLKIAHLTNLTYEQVNVILLVFMHPLITLVFILLYLRTRQKLKSTK
jgi:hypothetical protein